MRTITLSSRAIFIVTTLFLTGLLATSGLKTYASQTSVVSNYDTQCRYVHLNDWDLSNTIESSTLPGVDSGNVVYKVVATKTSGTTTFTVYGGLTVTNTGGNPSTKIDSDTATIGNIIINLQQQSSQKVGKKTVGWISLAADMADSTSGDSSTQANFVASATTENSSYNQQVGPDNYGVSGSRGTFFKTAGSGQLTFTDASSNTVCSLVPQITIAKGASVTLLYKAEFDASILPAPGTPLRVETITTYGNATGNGNSNYGSNIDINGNGRIDPNEQQVLTLPFSIQGSNLPATPEEYHGQVTVTDIYPDDITATGSASVTNVDGFGSTTISNTTAFSLSVDYRVGTDGGTIMNTAHLYAGQSAAHALSVVIGRNPDNSPIYATYECAPALGLKAYTSYTATGPTRPEAHNGTFTTYGQGGWGGKGHGSTVSSILTSSFYQVYPCGFVEIGIPGDGGCSMTFTKPSAIRNYLPASGTDYALNADLLNPTETHAGTFGGQVLALQLNVDFSRAGITMGTGGPVGQLTLWGTGTSLDGLTVSQVLAVSNNVIGGGGLPYGVSLSTFSNMLDQLNNSFAGGKPSPWATEHLL